MKKLFLALLTISLVQWGESIDANACQSSPCVHGSCFSGPAGYLCVCDHGYTGIHCDSSIGGIETCLSCPARLTDVPCTHVQKCSSGQQCFARILATSSGDLLHEYGCKDSQTFRLVVVPPVTPAQIIPQRIPARTYNTARLDRFANLSPKSPLQPIHITSSRPVPCMRFNPLCLRNSCGSRRCGERTS
ncbi:hypothetical protein MAR_017827 [Mya arenaria]|uniref:EGF-like domain-containing protein n=1 Tax=Mya arenaria TaxID=6604 RepID=A0ABY7EFL1_MYAAR|nr:hypothetical protein MAR_017827 [Mya arenaria]